ncbi:hypothetical protein Tco_0553611 [Tanacetum coccineum]
MQRQSLPVAASICLMKEGMGKHFILENIDNTQGTINNGSIKYYTKVRSSMFGNSFCYEQVRTVLDIGCDNDRIYTKFFGLDFLDSLTEVHAEKPHKMASVVCTGRKANMSSNSVDDHSGIHNGTSTGQDTGATISNRLLTDRGDGQCCKYRSAVPRRSTTFKR